MSGVTVTASAPAKLNFYLHVTGRIADGPLAGYHTLDSLIAFAGLADTVTVAPADFGVFSLTLDGPFATPLQAAGPQDDNLVVRAARALDAHLSGKGHGPHGWDIRLTKHIPVAAGLGGGSADAAATLNALAQLWDADALPLADIALTLGADVPVCLASRPARVTGVGENLAPAPPLPALGLVLANPGVAVETRAVFLAFDAAPAAPVTPPRLPGGFRDAPALANFLIGTGNDLTRAARGLAPVIGDVLDALGAQAGCRLARMAGSGATCFAIHDDAVAAGRAAAALADAHPDWWVWSGAPARSESE